MKTIIGTIVILLIINISGFGQNSICQDGFLLCSSQPVTVDYLLPSKDGNTAEIPCLANKSYYNQITFFWKTASAAELEFDIIPLDLKDDIDFVLYKLDESNLECENWESKRCMAEGPNLIDQDEWLPCTGITGLKAENKFTERMFGCEIPSTNFLGGMESEIGEVYALKIMNFTSFNGFILNFKNDIKFATPEEFSIVSSQLQESESGIIHSQGCIQRLGIETTKNNEVIDDSSISLFPNPSSNIISLVAKDFNFSSFRIVDQSGKVVNYSKLNDESNLNIQVSSLPGGIYMLELIDSTGTHHFRQFVKM